MNNGVRTFLLFCLFLSTGGGAAWAADRADRGPPPTKPANTVALPGKVDRVYVAGRGDFLLLRMNATQKLAVFDAKQEKIVGSVPLGGNDTLVAADADNIVLFMRDKKIVKRWSLSPLELKQTAVLDLPSETQDLVAGYASSGPMYLVAKEVVVAWDPSHPAEKPRVGFPVQDRWGLTDGQFRFTVSANGLTLAAEHGISPRQAMCYQFQGTSFSGMGNEVAGGGLCLNGDGTRLLTERGLYDSKLTRIDRQEPDAPDDRFVGFAPTLHPAFYLSVAFINYGPDGTNYRLRLCDDQSVVLALGLLSGYPTFMPPGANFLQTHLFVHPRLKKMVLLTDDERSVNLFPLDVLAAFDAKQIKYLYVDTLPPNTCKPGAKYEYAVGVQSKAGGVKYQLDDAPQGMTVDAQGVVRWEMPRNYERAMTTVILNIEDASKKSIFHTFSILRSTPDAVAADAKSK